MLTNSTIKPLITPFRIVLLLLIGLLFLAVSVRSQNTTRKNAPFWKEYRGVTLGMTADDLTKKLGDPRSTDESGVFYVFSETENAQFLFDREKKVRTISIAYGAEHSQCPTYADIFGPAAVAEPKEDGSIFKMMRYEEAGFWITFNKTAGEKATIIITVQKL